MLTPIKDKIKRNNTASVIRSVLPTGSIVKSYCFYDGRPEFDICSDSKIFVAAQTISKQVYIFWECLRRDGDRLYDIVNSPDFDFQNPELFDVYQEKWHTYESPYIQAAFFYLLNKCSQTGKVSSGKLSLEGFNPLGLSRLKSFRFPENFHLKFEPQSTRQFLTQDTTQQEYLMISGGDFSYSLLQEGKSVGVEETPLNFREISKLMSLRNSKVILTHNYHKAVERFYKNCRFMLVDDYGNQTNNREMAKEIVVVNF